MRLDGCVMECVLHLGDSMTIYKGFKVAKIVTSDKAKRYKGTHQGTRVFAESLEALHEKIEVHIYTYR